MAAFDLASAFERTHGILSPEAPPQKITTLATGGRSVSLLTDPSNIDWQYDPVDFKTFCESPKHMKMLPRDWVDDGSGDGTDAELRQAAKALSAPKAA